MTEVQAFVLGIIQGLTEFLPVSSSGHLVMFQRLFGIEENVLTFDIAVHVATLIAVVFAFRKDIIAILKKPFGRLPLLIVIGTIPTVLIAFLFKDIFKSAYETGLSLGFGFILTGLILWYADSVKGKKKGLEKTTALDAVVIGAAQGIAIFPAVSRSGLTISGALFRGLNREFALRFSFLMSIPPILGGAIMDIYDISKSSGGFNLSVGILPLIIGMIVAGVSGYIAIKFMIKILTKGSLKIFSYYVFTLALFVLVDQIFFGKFFGRLF